MERIDRLTLNQPVTGLNLRPGTLGDQLTAPRTLVAFLRHLGCMFCREMVADLHGLSAEPGFPPVLLVTQSTEEDLAAFLATRWPEAQAIADPDRCLYLAFDIARARSIGAMAGPAVWSCGMRALAKGHLQIPGRPRPALGDPWLLSALFLLSPDGTTQWEYRAQHAGERPDYAGIPRGVRGEA
ncbi:MAG TPA: AhpC/TSA family protein [Tepidisphaeraceae bacterium]|jgi:hypothetical protein